MKFLPGSPYHRSFSSVHNHHGESPDPLCTTDLAPLDMERDVPLVRGAGYGLTDMAEVLLVVSEEEGEAGHGRNFGTEGARSGRHDAEDQVRLDTVAGPCGGGQGRGGEWDSSGVSVACFACSAKEVAEAHAGGIRRSDVDFAKTTVACAEGDDDACKVPLENGVGETVKVVEVSADVGQPNRSDCQVRHRVGGAEAFPAMTDTVDARAEAVAPRLTCSRLLVAMPVGVLKAFHPTTSHDRRLWLDSRTWRGEAGEDFGANTKLTFLFDARFK